MKRVKLTTKVVDRWTTNYELKKSWVGIFLVMDSGEFVLALKAPQLAAKFEDKKLFLLSFGQSRSATAYTLPKNFLTEVWLCSSHFFWGGVVT